MGITYLEWIEKRFVEEALKLKASLRQSKIQSFNKYLTVNYEFTEREQVHYKWLRTSYRMNEWMNEWRKRAQEDLENGDWGKEATWQTAEEMDGEREGGYGTGRIKRWGYAETDVLAIEDTEAPTRQQS